MNSIYDIGRYNLLTADINWPTEDLRLLPWGGPPTFTPNHSTVTQKITEGLTTKLGFSQAIVGMNALPDGLAQTGPVVIPGVPIGMTVTHFTLVRNGTCMKCNTCGGTSGCS